MALCLLVSSIAAAQSPMHVPEPTVNLGDTSFLDALGGPGALLEEIGDGYSSGASVAASGQLADPADTNSISSISHGVLLSQRRLLRAHYGVEILGVAAHVNAGDKGNAGGWADLTVSPLILQWDEQKLGSVRVDQRFVLDSELPVGEYRRSSGLSLSSHAYTVHPYYAITVFPREKIETSWRVHYLWNSTNHEPPTMMGASSTQAGQAIHFNATTAYNLGHGLWLGANGYHLKQITGPQANGISLRNSPEQVGSIGPGILWKRGKYAFYANGYHEFAAENRPEGNRLVLRVQRVFGKPPAADQ